jgi:CheY-like chemotaxis protein
MNQDVILCVDDEKVILNSLKGLLRQQFRDRYLYEIAESGEEGLAVLQEVAEEGCHIKLIICDWIMPGMKGGEFLLHTQQRYPDAKKIVLTGQASEDELESIRSKVNLLACLHKPEHTQQLLGLLEKELSQD